MLALGLAVFSAVIFNFAEPTFGAAKLAEADGSPAKPNLVFIFADAWVWGDFSCHGQRHVRTLYIDRLAVEGTDFSRFTVANGVCSPSRVAENDGAFSGSLKHRWTLRLGAQHRTTEHARLAGSKIGIDTEISQIAWLSGGSCGGSSGGSF